MGEIIPFPQPNTSGPRSFRELLERRVPVYVNRLLIAGGPRKTDRETVQTFADILGPRGDEMQFAFEPGSKKQKEAEANHEALAQCVAIMAFIPNGIRAFGLHIQVIDGELSMEPVEGTAGEFLHPAGHKQTGSYYTPRELIECLLDSALEPVLDEAIRGRRRP